ncbi:MAG: PrgI family protein [Candidatus Doudnabacteria bacterium]|nr:PrgI family protein [Candidatus Doudnabacteria bacterium]
MQFPVPQFTEVEDRIIGPLTVKQFGILFGAGTFVFLTYSVAGKSLTVLIVMGLLVGLPALGLAFAQFNGRPVYNAFGKIFQFITSPKVMVFHKEIYTVNSQSKLKDIDVGVKQVIQAEIQNPQLRIKEVRELLEKQASEEKELVGKIR